MLPRRALMVKDVLPVPAVALLFHERSPYRVAHTSKPEKSSSLTSAQGI
jgi:hypothetical protein